MTDDQFYQLLSVIESVKSNTDDLSMINMNLESITSQLSRIKKVLDEQTDLLEKIKRK